MFSNSRIFCHFFVLVVICWKSVRRLGVLFKVLETVVLTWLSPVSIAPTRTRHNKRLADGRLILLKDSCVVV
ncbi:unnamed protein product [Lathyrus oleraceus]